MIFYPVGNGDTTQLILADGRRLMFDFNHRAAGEDEDSPHYDLKNKLLEEFKAAGVDEVEVFAISHTDDDHVSGAMDFFELEQAGKYQGGDRIKIKTLWVPAVVLLERVPREEWSNYAYWKKEAWTRLLKGEGIRVFSKPAELMRQLAEKLAEQGESPSARDHLFVEPGQTVRDFTLAKDKIEFFCHCPFADHEETGDTVARNEESLIFQIRMQVGGRITNILQCGDSTFEILEWVVRNSTRAGNEDRLDWNLYNVPHHGSYQALGPDKREKETPITPLVEELLSRGQMGAPMVCSSLPIGETPEAYARSLPPHIQAKNAYQRILRQNHGGHFYVTMSEPSEEVPEPLVFEIGKDGLRCLPQTTKHTGYGSTSLLGGFAPRAAGGE